MAKQKQAQQLQQQFLEQMDLQFADLQKYAARRGQKQLLAKAVLWAVRDAAADNIGMSEDEKYTLARRVVAFSTFSYQQRGLTPEQTWAALIGV